MAILFLPIYFVIVLSFYVMFYVAIATFYIVVGLGYFFFYWLPVRVWVTRPRAAAPALAASHLWSNRAARDELRRVQHVKPPRKAQKLYTEPWVLHGHVYEKASLDRAWSASR